MIEVPHVVAGGVVGVVAGIEVEAEGTLVDEGATTEDEEGEVEVNDAVETVAGRLDEEADREDATDEEVMVAEVDVDEAEAIEVVEADGTGKPPARSLQTGAVIAHCVGMF